MIGTSAADGMYGTVMAVASTPAALIGLTVGRNTRHAPAFLQVRRTYADAIVRAGGTPVLIPPMDDADLLCQALNRLDGLLLPGGLDVEPFEYGEAITHPTVETDPVLDRLELYAARWAVARRVPTFAICRGQQVLNVALGGSLIQDLPAAGVDHPTSAARDDLVHSVSIEPDSRLAAILGCTVLEVNSLHHQAVGRVASGLRVVGRASDGTIEAVEAPDHPWLIGVQFHPEELLDGPSAEPLRHLFDAFVTAAAGRERTAA